MDLDTDSSLKNQNNYILETQRMSFGSGSKRMQDLPNIN
jgi:hypothetical protein